MTGDRRTDTGLAVLMLLSSAGTLVLFAHNRLAMERGLPDDARELAVLKREARARSLDTSYRVGKLVVNLPSRTSRLRFLDASVHLVPFREDDIKVFEAHKPMIQDKVIDIAGRMPPDELSSVSGKILLESRIKTSLNGVFGKNSIKRIYFTRFVVQ